MPKLAYGNQMANTTKVCVVAVMTAVAFVKSAAAPAVIPDARMML